MTLFKKITQTNALSIDGGLLIIRLVAGIFMMTHGYPKILKLTSGNEIKFMEFMGLSASVSLTLVVFSEFFCSAAVALGLFTRLALIPLIITMCVIIFDVHWTDPFGKKELPGVYLAVYALLFLSGPGKYSFDHVFSRRK